MLSRFSKFALKNKRFNTTSEQCDIECKMLTAIAISCSIGIIYGAFQGCNHYIVEHKRKHGEEHIDYGAVAEHALVFGILGGGAFSLFLITLPISIPAFVYVQYKTKE